jgi:hypothetical protein
MFVLSLAPFKMETMSCLRQQPPLNSFCDENSLTQLVTWEASWRGVGSCIAVYSWLASRTACILLDPKSTGQVLVRVRIDVPLGRISDICSMRSSASSEKSNMYTANVGCHSCSDTAATQGPTCQLSTLAIMPCHSPSISGFCRVARSLCKRDSTVATSSSFLEENYCSISEGRISTSDTLMHQSTYNVMIILLGRYTQQTNR